MTSPSDLNFRVEVLGEAGPNETVDVHATGVMSAMAAVMEMGKTPLRAYPVQFAHDEGESDDSD